MSNLGVIDLYQNTNKEKAKEFLDKTESTLRVVADSNKIVRDVEWIDIIEDTIPYLDKIFRSPNRFIANEEEILKIEQTKKVGVESIKHLSKHTNFIQTIDEQSGDVIPSKLLNVRKEETYNTYENRLIYTLMQNMDFFIGRKKEKLLSDLQNTDDQNKPRNDKNIEYSATSRINDEKVEVKINFNSTLDPESSSNTAKEKSDEIINRIEDIETKISGLKSSEVYKILDKEGVLLVREPIKKTNVILKNVNFQYAMKLWNYLRDHLDESVISDEEHKDYMDEGELKEYVNETFLLQYLSMKTLDDDDEENKDTKSAISNIILEEMIDKALDLNSELTVEDLTQMIAQKYEVIKYKKMEAMKEIKNIFKEHFNQYNEEIMRRNKINE